MIPGCRHFRSLMPSKGKAEVSKPMQRKLLELVRRAIIVMALQLPRYQGIGRCSDRTELSRPKPLVSRLISVVKHPPTSNSPGTTTPDREPSIMGVFCGPKRSCEPNSTSRREIQVC